MNFTNVFDILNLGIVILDAEYRIRYWNEWMVIHSGIAAEEMLDRNLFDAYPALDTPVIRRSFKSVFTFGNFFFFSQKLHGYLFPIKALGSFQGQFEHMQQSCTLCPLREGDGIKVTHICITVQDVTEVAAYEKILLEMNYRDSLTGAYNRRYFTSRLKEEFERHRRYKRSMSMLMIDIDHFKSVNDTHGHQCGDFILKSVSATIQSALRRVDILARYGGEEFCCILPETTFEPSMMIAERIRGLVESETYIYEGQAVRVTVSIGVPRAPVSGDTPESFLKNADDALYEAKKIGRNTVISFP
ncbi:MAG: diguanylate cyclase [Deltaproteobacteria bacterium]|nr:diguanylate cyclase [Deltaproteobacteria bacterium]